MEEGRKSQSRLQGEGDLTMSIHSIQHDYLDFRLKKAEETGIQRENDETALQRNLSKTCSRLIALNNLGNGGGLCLSAHSATKNSKSAVTT